MPADLICPSPWTTLVPVEAAAMENREFDYEGLVRPMESRMMRSIWRIVREREAAQDALQEALALIWNKAGLFYLVFGSVAVALMGFSRREIGAAFRLAAGRGAPEESRERAAYFWEAVARNAWILGVLGSAMNFTIVLGGGSGGIQDISNRMIQAFIVTFYGLVLAVVWLVPAMKLKGGAEKGHVPERPSTGEVLSPGPALPMFIERVTGYVLFAAVLYLTVFSLIRANPQTGPLPIIKVMLHGPAILVVFGGAIALALFMGTHAGARAVSLGFAMTGLVSLLLGLIQALFGFVHMSVQEIAAAVAFIISTSSFSLLGLVAVAAPSRTAK